MAGIKGKLITCDRCGKTTFVKFNGRDDEWGDIVDRYEPVPKGWKERITIECQVTLCPECYAEWEKVRNRFFGEEEV